MFCVAFVYVPAFISHDILLVVEFMLFVRQFIKDNTRKSTIDYAPPTTHLYKPWGTASLHGTNGTMPPEEHTRHPLVDAVL